MASRFEINELSVLGLHSIIQIGTRLILLSMSALPLILDVSLYVEQKGLSLSPTLLSFLGNITFLSLSLALSFSPRQPKLTTPFLQERVHQGSGKHPFISKRLYDDAMTPLKKRKREDEKKDVAIDPKGDIWVQLKDTKVLVSSNVLALASPVFDSMLNSKFRESKEHNLSPNGTHEISLLEDDARAFVRLSKALHHQELCTPVVPALLNLAVLCDKYQCFGAMRIHFERWIIDNLSQGKYLESPKKLSGLLLASYISDIPHLFKLISEVILDILRREWKDDTKRDSWYKMMVHPIVRHDLAKEIESKRQAIDRDVNNAFVKAIGHSENCACGESEKLISHFMNDLLRVKILPTGVKRMSPQNILRKLQDFPRRPHYDLQNSCLLSKSSMGAEFSKAVEDAVLRGLGLCLDCIRSNGKTMIDGKCRVPHRSHRDEFGGKSATKESDGTSTCMVFGSVLRYLNGKDQ